MPRGARLRLIGVLAVTVALVVSTVFAVRRTVDDARPVVTLTVLAGSELRDVLDDEELAERLRDETGVVLDPRYAGTLEGAERLVDGERYDLAWFSSDTYLDLVADDRLRARPRSSGPLMRSPVVLGVKRSVAERLGWTDGRTVSWAGIADAADAGELSFGMTSPATSNSGFSALVGVAGSARAIDRPLFADDVDPALLDRFFSGQDLAAGSSAYLTDAYLADQDRVDALVNYESELLALNEDPDLVEPLELVHPVEGAVQADYPMLLINVRRTAEYEAVVDFLRTPDVQAELTARTRRRPVVEGVAPDPSIPAVDRRALPLPGNLDTADRLIFAYLDDFRSPARTVYVLDTSTSMAGQRIIDLRRAFDDLTGDDRTITGQFARFRNEERVTLLPFAGTVGAPREFVVSDPSAGSPVLTELRDYVGALPLADSTAMFDALLAAYRLIAATPDERYYTSVVLMSDGESNVGRDLAVFRQEFEQLGAPVDDVPTFVIKFGDVEEPELREIATLTGGEFFDATALSLRAAFQDIRGFQ